MFILLLIFLLEAKPPERKVIIDLERVLTTEEAKQVIDDVDWNSATRKADDEWTFTRLSEFPSLFDPIKEHIPRINEFAKSLSVRPIELYDAWFREYSANKQNHLNKHLDYIHDELSLILQLTDGAFLSVCLPRAVSDEECTTDIWMGSGDIVAFHGRRQYHGVRNLEDGEIRYSLALFYAISGADTSERISPDNPYLPENQSKLQNLPQPPYGCNMDFSCASGCLHEPRNCRQFDKMEHTCASTCSSCMMKHIRKHMGCPPLKPRRMRAAA